MSKSWVLGSFLGWVIIGLSVHTAHAQFKQLPLVKSSSGKAVGAHFRKMDDPLALPFWDDFSAGTINENKWEALGTLPSMSVGIDPPSIGIVYFDGVDAAGSVYSQNRLENGDGDQLISMPLELSDIATELNNTVFLSFFWQAGGRGELPDIGDRLELYFQDVEGNWNLVWEQEGGNGLQNGSFEQALVQVDPAYQFSGFRFKFQHVGKLSGPFDTWVVDYIYLNKNRGPNDFFMEDRTLSQVPSSPFGKFGAVPFFEFSGDYLTEVGSQFKNLSNRFRAMEYSVLLKDQATQMVLEYLNQNTPLNPVPRANERRNFTSRSIDSFSTDPTAPFDLETEVQLVTGDGYLIENISGNDTIYNESIDFRINDTASYTLAVRDYFSYDKGTADYSAGINQRSGMLAMEYEVQEEAYISGISINFTNGRQRGSGIELMVWDSLGKAPLYTQETLIPQEAGTGNFSYFPIDTNIVVSGPFYIGFTQFTGDFIHVGLDKSGDTGEHVFFDVLGAWQQNEEVYGNLMMRPHLSLTPVVEIPDEVEAAVKYYPNPVTDQLMIEGEVSDLSIYDFQGRQIKVQEEGDKNLKILNFAQNPKGIYLIKYIHNRQPKTIRILVK